jgi:hypothetical protein
MQWHETACAKNYLMLFKEHCAAMTDWAENIKIRNNNGDFNYDDNN